MAECKDCIHFCVCSPYTAPNESYPEVGGCKCFKATTDVVPKSEVERLQAEVDQLHALLECGVFANSVEDWQKFLNEKRAEVAREIFEEIEKISKAPYGYLCLSNDEYAELKKKYI